ncbi:hypothetical protein RRG08_022670 [Elysia crispata]|uniref:Uncharacterized protein n=1 Tax=Elysia crispata TaxID=231223 RepID=A0AAE0Z2V4_9GAST|nr:hypothetical protein RRG08_022670 [Elysia crispata]
MARLSKVWFDPNTIVLDPSWIVESIGLVIHSLRQSYKYGVLSPYEANTSFWSLPLLAGDSKSKLRETKSLHWVCMGTGVLTSIQGFHGLGYRVCHAEDQSRREK